MSSVTTQSQIIAGAYGSSAGGSAANSLTHTVASVFGSANSQSYAGAFATIIYRVQGVAVGDSAVSPMFNVICAANGILTCKATASAISEGGAHYIGIGDSLVIDLLPRRYNTLLVPSKYIVTLKWNEYANKENAGRYVCRYIPHL